MKLGLTGGMGCGKSKVAKLLAKHHGYTWVDMDAVVHDLYKDPNIVADIQNHLDQQLTAPDGSIDRKKLSKHIAQDKNALKWLSSYIHPKAFDVVKAKMAQSENIVVEVPLLYEVGCEHLFEKIICVSCALDTLLKRLKENRDLSEEEINWRMSRQLPLEEKIARADYVISNDGSKDFLKAQVHRLAQSLHA